MDNADLRLFADDEGVWRTSAKGRRFGILWSDIYRVGGYKLDGVTEIDTCIVLDFEYGELIELHDCWPGFKDVVAAITTQLPGIPQDWYSRVERLDVNDPALDLWQRGEPCSAKVIR